MSSGSLNNLSSSYSRPIVSHAFPDTGLTAKRTTKPPIASPSDHSRLSPFGQLISALQQLRQAEPARYQQVIGQIAANLKTAAQTAQAEGNAAAENQLNQLANDFTAASESGQLPAIQDLAQAICGHHGHPYSGAASGGDDAWNPMRILLDTLSAAGIAVGKADP